FYPFYAAMGSNYESLFAGIAFIFYALPILFFSYKNRHAYSQLLFLLFPFVVSYRTTLGMCSIAYLFIVIFKKEKNYYLLSLSLLLANLSSGIVLSWLLCVLFNFKKILINHKKLVPVFIILFIGFIYSIISKFYYFFTAVAIKSTSGLLARSTIYVSYDQNQYGRLICYTILIIMLVTILTLILIRSGSSRNLLSFYASAIPAVFLEGLGLISYAICFLWFFVYVQPIVFKPREKPTIQPN
ncbi:MAG: hypothetical protein PSV35_03325, partial [bacterium]|nr:hypothetical protein [bacterium]